MPDGGIVTSQGPSGDGAGVSGLLWGGRRTRPATDRMDSGVDIPCASR